MRYIPLFLFLLLTELSLSDPKKLRVCVGDFPSYAIGLDYLYDHKEKYEVSLSTVHACSLRFQKKYFDLIMTDSFIFVTKDLEAADTRIVSLVNYSDGVDQVIGQKGRMSDLRGSHWALQRGTLSTVLLSFYLKSQGINLQDVILEDVKVENTPQAIGKTRFHGAVNWQPYARQAVARGGQVLATTADFPEKLFDFVVTRESVLNQHRALIKAYLKERLARARKREQLYASYAKTNQISIEQAIANLQGLYIYDSAESVWKDRPKILKSLQVSAEVADASQCSGQMVQAQLKQREKAIFDFSLLE